MKCSVWWITIRDIIILFLIVEVKYLIGMVNDVQIVNLSCGADNFSILMKKRLQETGKRCSYRNYGLHPTKVDCGLCWIVKDERYMVIERIMF